MQGLAGGVGGRGTGPRNGANFATCVVFLSVSNAYKKKDALSQRGGRGVREAGQGLGGGCKGFGSGGVGTEQISQRVSYFCHF